MADDNTDLQIADQDQVEDAGIAQSEFDDMDADDFFGNDITKGEQGETDENDTSDEEDESDKSGDDSKSDEEDDKSGKEGDEGEDTNDDDQSGESGGSSEGTETEASQGQQPSVEEVHQQLLGDISGQSGVQITTTDELVDRLKNPLNYISPELKAAAEYEAAGGDLATYYALKNLDFEQMEDKEVLLQKYLKDNPKQVYLNRAHAIRKFERDFQEKYSILSKSKADFEDEEQYEDWLNKNQDQIDFLKDDRKNDVAMAREEMKDWQKEKTAPPKTETGLSDEEARDFVENYKETAQKALSSFKGLTVSINDKSEDDYNLTMSDEVRNLVTGDVNEPSKLLLEIGVDPETGAVNAEKLRDASFMIRTFKQLGLNLKDHILERHNSETLDGHQDNPTKTKSGSEGQGSKDLLSELADDIEAKRSSQGL